MLFFVTLQLVGFLSFIGFSVGSVVILDPGIQIK